MEIREATSEEKMIIKAIADKSAVGSYDKRMSKLVIIEDGEVVGGIQYKPVVYIDTVFLDESLPLIRRAYLMIKVVKHLASASVSYIWGSYRYKDKKKKVKNEFLYRLYHTFGRKMNIRKKDLWYRF